MGFTMWRASRCEEGMVRKKFYPNAVSGLVQVHIGDTKGRGLTLADPYAI
jgi:hypothetical protein